MIKLENDQHKLLQRRYLIFSELYEKLSVKETAKYFETTSSNISTQMKKLASEVGNDLFFRTKYGLEATAQADRLYQDLQKILETVKPIYDDFIHKITSMNQSSTMMKRRNIYTTNML
ncbi:LysR family transcriptional regulator [Cysteiniphilum sp. 6C5]|uniref:LysR family transcriptional regulator n=1 Tax=unclassified Cysteiniphilum TaxID=2610889 RepID=UPI003F8532FF